MVLILPLSGDVHVQGLIKRAEQAKVAVFACGLEMSSTETKGTVLIRTGEELMSYNKVPTLQYGREEVLYMAIPVSYRYGMA